MRTPWALLGLVVCALPLFAQQAERHVVAPCKLTKALLIASGKESAIEGQEFSVRVVNNSKLTIALPRSPVFGWRVETLDKKVWRIKAEGGPVLRVKNRRNENDPHIVVIENSAPPSALLEIPPAHSEDFYTFVPEAEKALRPEGEGHLSTFKLTLYMAATAKSAQPSSAIPLCALAPEWIVTTQKPALPK